MVTVLSLPGVMVGQGTMEFHSLMTVGVIGCHRVRGQVGVLICYSSSSHNCQNKLQRSNNQNVLTFRDLWQQ